MIKSLIEQGATVIAIKYDLDMIQNADFIIDMSPGGGSRGGKILAEKTVNDIILNSDSIIDHWIKMNRWFCCKAFQKIYFIVKIKKKTERTE